DTALSGRSPARVAGLRAATSSRAAAYSRSGDRDQRGHAPGRHDRLRGAPRPRSDDLSGCRRALLRAPAPTPRQRATGDAVPRSARRPQESRSGASGYGRRRSGRGAPPGTPRDHWSHVGQVPGSRRAHRFSGADEPCGLEGPGAGGRDARRVRGGRRGGLPVPVRGVWVSAARGDGGGHPRGGEHGVVPARDPRRRGGAGRADRRRCLLPGGRPGAVGRLGAGAADRGRPAARGRVHLEEVRRPDARRVPRGGREMSRISLAGFRYAPAIGGAENYARRLLAEMGERVDAKVITLVTDQRTDWLKLLIDGVRSVPERYRVDG